MTQQPTPPAAARLPPAARVVLAAKRLVDDVAGIVEREAAAYRRGVEDGYTSGDHDGYTQGYTDGHATGREIGAAGILLALQTALGDQFPGLLPDLPYTGEYERLQELREELPTEPCPDRCGTCWPCRWTDTTARNLARYGVPDFPGREALRRNPEKYRPQPTAGTEAA